MASNDASLEGPLFISAENTARSPSILTNGEGGRSNLLSLKLAEILSTSYADSSIRDALILLGDRIQDNSSEMRRQFRANVEAEVIEANGQVLEQFSKIAMQLETIGMTINSMNQIVNGLESEIGVSKEQTRGLFVAEEKLSSERVELLAKQGLLEGLKRHFLLSDVEIGILTSSAEPVDDRFFDTVKKAKQIRNDCQALLASENSTIGVEVMDRVSKYLDLAYDRLYYWVQREIRNLSTDDTQIRRSMRRSLGLLAERPTSLQNCLDALSEIRQKIVLHDFMQALTSGYKPIELAAYDPFRYVGDILAWIHSETVNEKEVLELVFLADEVSISQGLEEGMASEPWAEHLDVDRTIKEITDKNLHLICKPLKARIDQALAGHITFTLAYRIRNLLEFYRSTFSKYLLGDAQLLNVIRVLETSAFNQFHRFVKENIQIIQTSLPPTTPDLQPPQFLHESLAEMKTLMSSYDTSYAEDANEREKEFSKIIEEALEPYLNCCTTMSNVESLSIADRNIFLINCYDAARSTLQLFPFTRLKLAEYDSKTSAMIEVLTKEVHVMFLTESTLGPALKALQAKAPETALSSLEQFQDSRITQLAIALDDFLPSALMDAQTFLQRLVSPKISNQVIESASRAFVDDFTAIENAIVESIEFPRSLFPRTTADVKVLLVLE
ncbi:oligomeric Golgi complex subunit 6 [Dipodascopsis uninucleata]